MDIVGRSKKQVSEYTGNLPAESQFADGWDLFEKHHLNDAFIMLIQPHSLTSGMQHQSCPNRPCVKPICPACRLLPRRGP